MAKPNFGFQKRQREQAKERKKQEKAARKAERAAEQGPDALMGQDAPADGTQADGPESGDQQA